MGYGTRGNDRCISIGKGCERSELNLSWATPGFYLLHFFYAHHRTQSLLQIHATASEHKDENFCDFLETEFLQEQVDSIKEISDHVTNLKRVGEGLGVYMFDRNLAEDGAEGHGKP